MKKVFFLPFVLTLLTAWCLAAQSVYVSGHVTISGTSIPLPNTPVFIGSLDSMSGISNVAITDQDGFYESTLELPGGSPSVLVSVEDHCDPTGGWSLISVDAPIINGTATADFAICPNPPMPDCWAYADFSGSGLTLDFSAFGYGIDSTSTFTFTWDFGDSTTATGQQVTHTFPQMGYYEVLLTATSSTGCVTYSYVYVYAYEPYSGPVDSITISGLVTNIVTGDPIPFAWVTAEGVDPWNPTYSFTDEFGVYSLVVAVPEGAATVDVQTYDYCDQLPLIQTAPIVNYQAAADFQICYYDIPPIPGCAAYITYVQTDSLTFQFTAETWTNDSTGFTNYFWDFGDGNTSTEANPTHSYAQEGIYTISLNANDGSGCIAYGCEVICTFGGGVIDTFWYGCQAMFYANPTLDPTNPAGISNTYQFYDASFGATVSWSWDFGDGSVDSTQNPIHTYAQTGIYVVTLHTTTLDGCESEIAMEVWVGNNPWNEWGCQAMFLPLPDSGSTGFQFVDLSYVNTPITSWAWDFGDGTTSNEQNPYHAFSQGGVYTVSLTITADSCNSIFSIDFDTQDPFNFREGLPALGQAAGVLKTEDKPVFESLKLFPNPTIADLSVAFDSPAAMEVQLEIVDLAGKTLVSTVKNTVAGPNVMQVNVANLPQGMYLAQLKSAKSVQTIKFAKQ